MKIDNSSKAFILSETLPYMKKYYGKTVVIKYGGNAMINPDIQNQTIKDIVLLNLVGVKVVLVHGGGPAINDTLKKMNIESQFIDGLRVTDKNVANVVQMVLAGKINKDLVNLISSEGGVAVGMCGCDGNLFKCGPLDEVHGYAGVIESVNPNLIKDALNNNYIPVVSTVGFDYQCNPYNVNADTGASEIAAALEADALISVTDVSGLLTNKDDESSVISKIKVSDISGLEDKGIIGGGMIPKIDSIVKALNNGVKSAYIIDGRISHSILIEMFTDEGIGTMFIKG